MKKLNKIYHILMGLRYGYPPCCIKFFIENYDYLEMINEYRYGGYWNLVEKDLKDNRIKCEKCWELGI